MNGKLGHVLILLPWLSIPAVAVGFMAFRERLPERLAVHFNSSGAADSWMSPWVFLAFFVGVLVFMLANFTWKLASGREPDKFYVQMLFYYAGTAIVLGVFVALLKYNL